MAEICTKWTREKWKQTGKIFLRNLIKWMEWMKQSRRFRFVLGISFGYFHVQWKLIAMIQFFIHRRDLALLLVAQGMKMIPLNSRPSENKETLIRGVDLSTTGTGPSAHWRLDDVKVTLDLIKWYDYQIAKSIAIIGQMCRLTFPLWCERKADLLMNNKTREGRN